MSKKKNSKVVEEVVNKGAKEAVMSREDILSRCKAIESRVVPVPGWGAGVRMKNLTFKEIMDMRINGGEDMEARNAIFVAAVCEDLTIEDAYQLQSGNGTQFALLYAAVDTFLNNRLGESNLKN